MIGTGRRQERLDALAAELGDNFRPITLDMRDIPAVEAVAAEVGAVDLLLNNAGLPPPLATLQDAEWAPLAQVVETNITGLVALTRELLPGLIARKGAIINLSSVAATYPYRGGAVYGGSKAFVRQFSLDLRCDLQGTGGARHLDRAGHGRDRVHFGAQRLGPGGVGRALRQVWTR